MPVSAALAAMGTASEPVSLIWVACCFCGLVFVAGSFFAGSGGVGFGQVKSTMDKSRTHQRLPSARKKGVEASPITQVVRETLSKSVCEIT